MNITFVALILSLVISVYSTASFADVPWPACQIDDSGTGNTIQETLSAVGFGQDGLTFAYIKKGYYEGMGSYYWELQVSESDGSARLEKVRELADSSSRTDPPMEFREKIKGVLEKYSIVLTHSPRVQNFPYNRNGSAVRAYIIPSGEDDNGGVKTTTLDVFLADDKFNHKSVGQVRRIEFFGHLKRYDYQVVGYIQGPHNKKLLTVVGYKNRADESSDLICKFSVFGATTELPPASQTERAVFLESLGTR